MSDFELPELPSDDELGITEEDREEYEAELSETDSELSAEERAAFLGDTGRQAEQAGPTPPEDDAEPTGVRRPRSRWKGPLTLAALAAVALTASTRTGQPSPAPANAPDTAFSSARAMSVLVDIARRPRPIGSPEHARVRQLLLDRLADLGLETEVQTTTTMAQVSEAARAATVRNVIGRLPGTAPTGAVLVAAHYDSRELAPGAADDGAGLVAVLEAVRALRAGAALRNDLIVLFTDAEEPCLCGARAFVEQHRWIDDVSVVLNFEMRGAAGPSLMFETNENNGWVVRALSGIDPPPYANSMAYEVYRRMPNNTDFTEFKEAGKQGLNFAALDRADVYHQAADRPENLSEATLQHHGLGALAMMRYLGEADLRSVDAPDVTYVTLPLVGLVAYSASWVVPLSGILLALAALVSVVLRARGARPSAVIVGLGVAILGGASAFGFALWLRGWIMGFHAEAGSLSGAVLHSEGWWVLAAVAGTFFIVTTLHGLARRWLSTAELSFGALLLPLGLAIAASLYVPLGALNLQWPLASVFVALLVGSLLGHRSDGTIGWIVSLVMAAPVLAILVPVVELVWLAMTVQLIAFLSLFVALTLHLCLPALDWLRQPNSWWAPLTGLAVAVLSFTIAMRASQPTASRPAPSTLAYAYEHGRGAALWLTDPVADPTFDARAIEWAEERAGQPFSQTRDMRDFGFPGDRTPIAQAPLIDAPPPTVLVQTDSVEGPVRSVSLLVRSNLGAELLRFQLDSAGHTQLLSLNGATVEEPGILRWAEHYGVPEGEGVRLRLRMPAAEPIGLHVVEHFLRPDELLGTAPFERPDDLMPDVSAMSDRAVFRYSVAAYADPRHAFMPPGPEERPVAPDADR